MENLNTSQTVVTTEEATKMTRKIRVMLLDDQELIRYGLRYMLKQEEDIEVVGDYASAEKAFAQLHKVSPDIVLVDSHMPGMSGIKATYQLKKNGLRYGGDVIMLAESADCLADALANGADGFLLKDAKYSELVRTIRDVHAGKDTLDQRNLPEVAIDLVVPPPATSGLLLKFMCQLKKPLEENFGSLMHTVGSWDWGTAITIALQSARLPNFMAQLTSLPGIEIAEESRKAIDYPAQFGNLPGTCVRPSKRFRISIKEAVPAGR